MTKSSAQLEREAELTRDQLAATLEELRSRITPGQLLDQTLDYARESNVGELMRNFGRDARDNPLPLALIGAGLAWLMMTNGRRRGFDAAYADAARSATGAVGADPGETGAAGGSFLAFCREHPLVLAGVGLALGGVLGAALPSSKGEEREANAPGSSDLRAVEAASAPESSVVPVAPGELET